MRRREMNREETTKGSATDELAGEMDMASGRRSAS